MIENGARHGAQAHYPWQSATQARNCESIGSSGSFGGSIAGASGAGGYSGVGSPGERRDGGSSCIGDWG